MYSSSSSLSSNKSLSSMYSSSSSSSMYSSSNNSSSSNSSSSNSSSSNSSSSNSSSSNSSSSNSSSSVSAMSKLLNIFSLCLSIIALTNVSLTYLANPIYKSKSAISLNSSIVLQLFTISMYSFNSSVLTYFPICFTLFNTTFL